MVIKLLFLFLFSLHLSTYTLEEEKISTEEPELGLNALFGIILLSYTDTERSIEDRTQAKEILKILLAGNLDIDALNPKIKSLILLPPASKVLKEHYDVAKKECFEALSQLPLVCVDIITEYAFYSPDFIDLHDQTKRITVLNKKRKRKESFSEYTGSEKFLDSKILKSTISYCVKEGDFSLLKYLIKSGADVNCVDEKGIPLLAHAIKSRSLEMIRFLLENKADPNYVFKDGSYKNYPLFIVGSISTHDAHEKKFVFEALKLFIEYKTNINWFPEDKILNTLKLCACLGYFDCVKLLVGAGTDVNFKDHEGKKASNHAYERGYNYIGDFLRKRETPNEN